MQFFSSQAKFGILGGGQLGKMLLYTTRKWDINTHVLDPSAVAPSRIACDHFEQGDFKDCLLYTSPSPRDRSLSRMPSSA